MDDEIVGDRIGQNISNTKSWLCSAHITGVHTTCQLDTDCMAGIRSEIIVSNRKLGEQEVWSPLLGVGQWVIQHLSEITMISGTASDDQFSVLSHQCSFVPCKVLLQQITHLVLTIFLDTEFPTKSRTIIFLGGMRFDLFFVVPSDGGLYFKQWESSLELTEK